MTLAAPTERETFVVTLRAEPGTDATRALRGLLKLALRRFRLRCIGVREARRSDGRGSVDALGNPTP
jgi:hypothetical protein